MVCDASLGLTIVSYLVNGACCLHQMQEEDLRREAIRKDIRVEWERQRLMERELMELKLKEQQGKKNASDDVLADEERRRRQIISRKIYVSNSKHDAGTSKREENSQPLKNYYEFPCSPKRVRSDPQKKQTQAGKKENKKPWHWARRRRPSFTYSVQSDTASDMSSLLDTDDSNEEDSAELAYLQEVALR